MCFSRTTFLGSSLLSRTTSEPFGFSRTMLCLFQLFRPFLPFGFLPDHFCPFLGFLQTIWYSPPAPFLSSACEAPTALFAWQAQCLHQFAAKRSQIPTAPVLCLCWTIPELLWAFPDQFSAIKSPNPKAQTSTRGKARSNIRATK